MLRIDNIPLPLDYTDETLKKRAVKKLRCRPSEIRKVTLSRRAVDARHGVHFTATLDVTVRDEDALLKALPPTVRVRQVQPFVMPHYERKNLPHPPVVIGAGPAGLFAAWVLAQAGLCPLLLERGKPVPERQKAVAQYHLTGRLDPECNVQFGEGGAGTFSDGKLNTGTNSPYHRTVFQTFADCGAPEEILWQAMPHIGTDRLAVCIPALRRKIEQAGGKVLFSAKCTGITARDGRVVSVEYEQDGRAESVRTDHVVLAVGHSARDVFRWLYDAGIRMIQKPFSLGLRIEHRQRDIDRLCYGDAASHPRLSAASYRLVAHGAQSRTLSGGMPLTRTVYSFCMCPGGTVQAAASEPETVVTNGMSCFARDGENANSALLAVVQTEDFGGSDPLAGVRLQRQIEQAAYRAGGCSGKAPVTLLADFLKGQNSAAFGNVMPTYPLGTVFARPESCLPEPICQALRDALPKLEQGLHGFLMPDAVLTAPETRSSSPVCVLRDADTLESVSLHGLYPCGEGAGYAGGIVSAAADGIRCAEQILGCRPE